MEEQTKTTTGQSNNAKETTPPCKDCQQAIQQVIDMLTENKEDTEAILMVVRTKTHTQSAVIGNSRNLVEGFAQFIMKSDQETREVIKRGVMLATITKMEEAVK